jgi:hypothetical protein
MCSLACSDGGRHFAILNDDRDDGDDEPQNYFAGSERRHVLIAYRFPALFSLPFSRQNPDRGPPDVSGGRGVMRDPLTRALDDRAVEPEPEEGAEIEPILGERIHAWF